MSPPSTALREQWRCSARMRRTAVLPRLNRPSVMACGKHANTHQGCGWMGVCVCVISPSLCTNETPQRQMGLKARDPCSRTSRAALPTTTSEFSRHRKGGSTGHVVCSHLDNRTRRHRVTRLTAIGDDEHDLLGALQLADVLRVFRLHGWQMGLGCRQAFQQQ